MGRGNVCVTGKCEGLYYIDRGYTDVYRRSDDEFETRLREELSYDELTGEIGSTMSGEARQNMATYWIALWKVLHECSRFSSGSIKISGSTGVSGSFLKASCSTSALRTTSGRWR